MSHSEKYLASLCVEPKNSQDSMAIAVQVIPDTIDTLRATGVVPFTIAVVLGLEIKKLAQEHGWSEELKRQFIPPAFWHLVAPDNCDDDLGCLGPAS